MTTEAFTVRTESNIVQTLDGIAESLDRSRNYLVNQAIKEFLESNSWQIEKISHGIEAADRGELVGHDQLMQEMEELIDSKDRSKA